LKEEWFTNFTPLPRIDVDYDGTRTAYLGEALSFEITPRSATVVGSGIELGTVEADGSGTPEPVYTVADTAEIAVTAPASTVAAEIKISSMEIAITAPASTVAAEVVQDGTAEIDITAPASIVEAELVQGETVDIDITAPASTVAAEVEIDSTVDLTSNLVAWYKFDGNLNDSSSNNTPLIQLGSGTPAYVVSGLDQSLDNAADAVQTIQASSVDNLHTSGFYIAIVFDAGVYPDGRYLASKAAGRGAANLQFILFNRAGSDDVRLEVFNSSNGMIRASTLQVTTPGYHLVEAYLDPSVGSFGQIGVAVDNGTFATNSLVAAMRSGTGTSHPLGIGGLYDPTSPDDNWSFARFRGDIEMFAIWDGVFSDLSPTGAERSALWNGGSFRADP
jgi:hypothetical protein